MLKINKRLKCSETARQSKHCGCTALCSCGAFSQWKLSKATPTKSTHCHFNFHTYHLTGSALFHVGAVTYIVLLYLSNCEIWSNCTQILRFGQIYSFLETWRFCKILEYLQSVKKLFAREFHLFVKMGFGLSRWVGIWATAFPSTDYVFKSWSRIPKGNNETRKFKE